MNTVFLTGATGFIGANLTRLLLKRGYHVRALVRDSSDLSNLAGTDVELVRGDLRDKNSFAEKVKGSRFVFHTAAQYLFWSLDPKELYDSNVEGTRNVLEAARDASVERVVYTSTVGTIGLGNLTSPCNENSSLIPGQFGGHYKQSKFDAERVALEFAAKGLPVVIVNPSAPVGPYDRKPTPTGKIILDFVLGRMPAYLETGLNLVHVEDVCRGHMLACEKGAPGQRYILGGTNMSLEEILKLLERLSGKRAPRFKIPYSIAWLAGWTSTAFSDWITHESPAIALEAVKMARRHMYFDSSKAIRELGYSARNVEEAIKDALIWFENEKYFTLKGAKLKWQSQ